METGEKIISTIKDFAEKSISRNWHISHFKVKETKGGIEISSFGNVMASLRFEEEDGNPIFFMNKRRFKGRQDSENFSEEKFCRSVGYRIVTMAFENWSDVHRATDIDWRKKYDFGTIFHRTLRVSMDNDYSVVLWNMIHLIPNEIFEDFCNYCDPSWKDGFDPVCCALGWASNRRYIFKGEDEQHYYMFQATLKMMDNDSRESINAAFECLKETVNVA
jgi:hypothetical protein